jgi:hypothetical protein
MRGTGGARHPLRIRGEAGGTVAADAETLDFTAFNYCPDGSIRLASIVGDRTSPSKWRESWVEDRVIR